MYEIPGIQSLFEENHDAISGLLISAKTMLGLLQNLGLTIDRA
jgi:hypothetical protein